MKHATLRERAQRETRRFVGVAAYLCVMFSAFIMYRRLVEHEVGIKYLHYGASVISALVVAKVVLIGQALKVGERHRMSMVIVPVLYKAALYSVLVLAAGRLERIVEGLVHGEGARIVLMKATVGRGDEILARR